jgi:hypothetical protein
MPYLAKTVEKKTTTPLAAMYEGLETRFLTFAAGIRRDAPALR